MGLTAQQLGPAEHHLQCVVEVVSDTTGQTSDRVELLRLLQRRLRLRELVLRVLAQRLFRLQACQCLRTVRERSLEAAHHELHEDGQHPGHAYEVDRAGPRTECFGRFRATDDRHGGCRKQQAAEHARTSEEERGDQNPEPDEEHGCWCQTAQEDSAAGSDEARRRERDCSYVVGESGQQSQRHDGAVADEHGGKRRMAHVDEIEGDGL